MKRFLIYTNIHKDEELALTTHIRTYLEAAGCEVHMLTEETANDGDEARADMCRGIPENLDCILVLGGDGTMLRAVRDVKELHVPILGINLGTLGYMTEVEPEHIDEALKRLLDGDVELEERMMLKAVLQSADGSEVKQWALNDVVIARCGSLQINDFNIYVNGQFLKKYSADGVIVTTPTGSTGYNLSAGGPIAAPTTKLMMITPICPHTMYQRSIILSSEDEIVIEIPKGRAGKEQETEASFDGSGHRLMRTGDRIVINKSEQEVVFLKLNKISFLEILSRKMSEN